MSLNRVASVGIDLRATKPHLCHSTSESGSASSSLYRSYQSGNTSPFFLLCVLVLKGLGAGMAFGAQGTCCSSAPGEDGTVLLPLVLALGNPGLLSCH